MWAAPGLGRLVHVHCLTRVPVTLNRSFDFPSSSEDLQYDALLFLANREPVFTGGQAKLTRDAVEHVVHLYEELTERLAAPPDELRDFLLQCLWCLFAEDLGQLQSRLSNRRLVARHGDLHDNGKT